MQQSDVVTVVPVLSERFKYWAALMAGFALVAAVGPHLNPSAYQAPVFQVVGLIPFSIWSAGWLAAAVFALGAMFTRHLGLWVAACLFILFPSLFWLLGIAYAHYILGSQLSPVGQALWVYVVCSMILLVTSPHQVSSRIHVGQRGD